MVDRCVWTLEVLIPEEVLHTYQLMLSGQTVCRLWWCHFRWIYYPSSFRKLNSCSSPKSWWEQPWFLEIQRTVRRHPWHHLLWSKFLLLTFANFWIQHFSKKLASAADLSQSPFLRRVTRLQVEILEQLDRMSTFLLSRDHRPPSLLLQVLQDRWSSPSCLWPHGLTMESHGHPLVRFHFAHGLEGLLEQPA